MLFDGNQTDGVCLLASLLVCLKKLKHFIIHQKFSALWINSFSPEASPSHFGISPFSRPLSNFSVRCGDTIVLSMQQSQEYEDYLDAGNDDSITALEYNIDGEYLATGDRNGRITVLKVDSHSKTQKQENWLPYFQFQSHEPEFDFLKSLEIEAKINQIKFCRPVCGNNFLLSTNDKTIKLWKIGPRKQFISSAATKFSECGKLELPKQHGIRQRGSSNNTNRNNSNTSNGNSSYIGSNRSSGADVEMEEDRDGEEVEGVVLHATTKRVFANAHTYHINSLAMNSDGQTFVSADDLRINWWDLEDSNTSFNIIDIKPENMEELTEVITAVQFHPQHCHMLIYSSSRGAIKVCDTRASALCTGYAKTYQETATSPSSGGGAATNKSFIADILNSISDVNYSQDGRYLVSRDYLTVKIWDVNMESRPVKTVALHDYLKPMLYDLYTSDIIFDKFEVCCSANGKGIATGSYSNQLKVYHQDSRSLKQIDLPNLPAETEGDKNQDQSQMYGISPTSVMEINGLVHDLSRSLSEKAKMVTGSGGSSRDSLVVTGAKSPTAADVQLEDKVLHCTWHPNNNTIAVAGKAGLCLYKV